MNDRPSYRLYVAGIILLAYLILAGVLLSWIRGNVSPESWNQIVVIFNAVGALATTAAGILFGAEVQQANTNNAARDAQAHAAASARKGEVMLQALNLLDSNDGASGDAGTAQARSLLLRAVASPAPASS